MHPLEKKTLQTVRLENLLQAGDKVIVGISGGPDSMALMHVLARLSPVLGITLAAAYVNHGLRPAEAEEEESLAAAEAKSLGIDFFSARVNVKGLAACRKFSIEHAARLLRYAYFEKIAQDSGAPKIALAHTADDQAEEILLRLVRGTARKGLSGMKTLRAGKFIRPFLHFPKALLLQYLDNHSIPFLIDSSNMENLYLRNRIRNELLPYLAERFNPGIRETLIRTAAILQDEEELLETITASAFANIVSIRPETATQVHNTDVSGTDTFQQQVLRVNPELLRKQPRAIQRRILEICCWRMGCTPRSRQIEQLMQLAMPDSHADSLHLSAGLRIIKSKKCLTFAYPCGRGSFRGNLRTGSETGFRETVISAPGSYVFPSLRKRLIMEEVTEFMPGPDDFGNSDEYLDANSFSYPLTLRLPRAGDRFHPLGAPGSKKVFDFLREQKIGRDERRLTPVLCTGESIIVLPGLRIDHGFRITEKTVRAVRLIWEDMV